MKPVAMSPFFPLRKELNMKCVKGDDIWIYLPHLLFCFLYKLILTFFLSALFHLLYRLFCSTITYFKCVLFKCLMIANVRGFVSFFKFVFYNRNNYFRARYEAKKKTLCRHECFTGQYTTCKTHTKLHPGLEWHIFYILTSKDIDDFTALKFVFLIVL